MDTLDRHIDFASFSFSVSCTSIAGDTGSKARLLWEDQTGLTHPWQHLVLTQSVKFRSPTKRNYYRNPKQTLINLNLSQMSRQVLKWAEENVRARTTLKGSTATMKELLGTTWMVEAGWNWEMTSYFWGTIPYWQMTWRFTGLVYGKIYRKALYFMGRTMVSCRFSLQLIQWTILCFQVTGIFPAYWAWWRWRSIWPLRTGHAVGVRFQLWMAMGRIVE